MPPATWLRWLRHRLRLLTDRSAVEQEMAEEMRTHIEEETADLIRGGLPAEAARRRALVAFGGIERFKEEGRDARGGRRFEDFITDLRYAMRVLRLNPGFTLTAVATFAIGIGASTAIFSVVRGVVLAPLPYRQPQQLVALWERTVTTGKNNIVSVDEFEDWRRQLHDFTGMAALIPAPVSVSRDGRVERVAGVQVTPGYFSLLGVHPALGRDFLPTEEADGGAAVAILSDGYWRSHLGADSGVIGKSLVVDGRAVTVVGVMPAGFDPPRYGWIDEQQLWLPFGLTAQNREWGHVLHVVARLKPEVVLAGANADLARVGGALAGQRPEYKDRVPVASPLSREITGEIRGPLLLLLGGVLLLLLMAVTNVGNLTLGQLRRRTQELAIRRALGASAARITRQLLTQSAVLGALGAAAGLGVAYVGVRLLLRLLPTGVPHTDGIRINAPVLLAALAATCLATLAFGSVAGIRGSDRGTATSSMPGPSSARVTSRRGGGALVMAELSLAMILTLLAGLLVRSFANLRAVELGFNPAGVVVGRVALGGDRYASPAAERAFWTQLLERLRATPGVASAGLVTVRPFRGGAPATRVADPTNPPPPGVEAPITDIRFADSTLFGTLGIPFVAGAPFAEHESPDGPPRVVVNPALVRALNLPANPIGRHVAITLNGGIDAEIIGVVNDVYLSNPRTAPRGTAWLAADRYPDQVNDVVLRGPGDAESLEKALRDAVLGVDPTVPVYEVGALKTLVDGTLARDRFTALLIGAFALIALLLAAVGTYGVLSADVTRRQAEIGIRRALGASATTVIALVLRQGLVLVSAGIAVGGVLGLVLARGIASLLFGIGILDLPALAGVTAVLLATATLAALLPAWRALRISPLSAMRGRE